MLLRPQFYQLIRQPHTNGREPVNAGVASSAKRNQPLRRMDSLSAVMDMERAPALPCSTRATAPTISLEHKLALSSEVAPIAARAAITATTQSRYDRDRIGTTEAEQRALMPKKLLGQS